MAKRSSKNKIVLYTVIFFMVVIFIALCYFYPPFLDKLKSLFNRENDDDSKVIGDTTYVTELRDLKVHFVDVGQGDCILIELPDGKNVIIDSGDNTKSTYNDVKNYIQTKTGIKQFDYAIATHADADHIGSFDDILRDFEVRYVYRPYVFYSGSHHQFSTDFNKGSTKYKQQSKAYGDFLDLINKETYLDNGETKRAGWEFFSDDSDFAGKISYNETVYDYYFDFLTPKVDDLSEISYKDANDYSPIIKFTYCGVDVLFTGDAEKEAEADFVNFYKNRTDLDLDVDILKVGHHGSETSTSQEFLDLVKPERAVIQCGVNNSYKHPRQNTLNRLLESSIAVFRNDLQGDILLTITAQGNYSFATEKQNTNGLYVGQDQA